MARNQSIDYLKLLSACMVVGIHAFFLRDINPFAYHIFVEGFFRMGVPFFLLINGFYFYKTRSTRQWFSRIVQLYLFWSVFYAFFWFRPEHFSMVTVVSILRAVFWGYYHLWYFPGIIGAALLVTLMRTVSDRFFLSVTLTLFLIGIAIEYTGSYHLFYGTQIDVYFNHQHAYRNFLFFAFPLFALGYFAHKHNVVEKIGARLLSLICILGLLLVFLESSLAYVLAPSPIASDLLLSFMVACPAIFLLATKINIPGNTKDVSSMATAIYLIHPFFLYFIPSIGETEKTIVVIGLSFLAAILLICLKKTLRFIL